MELMRYCWIVGSWVYERTIFISARLEYLGAFIPLCVLSLSEQILISCSPASLTSDKQLESGIGVSQKSD